MHASYLWPRSCHALLHVRLLWLSFAAVGTSSRTRVAEPSPDAIQRIRLARSFEVRIVIGFGMTAFLLVLIYRTYRVTKEDEISALKGDEDDE